MPTPRTSISPASSGTVRASRRPPVASSRVRSSDTSRANASRPASAACRSASARRDLPDPDGPRISTARGPTSTAVACIEGRGLVKDADVALSHRRQTQSEACAEDPVVSSDAVLGPQLPAMGFDDLFGDRQPKSGVLTEILLRAIRVEALEDFLECVGPDSRAIVLDRDLDRAFGPAALHAHDSAGRRERAGVVDQIVDD